MRAHTNINIITLVAWFCFIAGLSWAVLLVVAIVSTQVTHAVPLRFFDWIVEIQIRGTNHWPLRDHQNAYYFIRFFVFTLLVECVGVWGFFRLRSKSKVRPPEHML